MKPKQTNEIQQYAAMGMAAMLPGMIHAREILDRQIQEMQEQLAGMQGKQGKQGKKKDGRGANAASYWAKMTPEERNVEMARRGMVGRGHRISPEGREKIAETQRNRWAKLKAKREAAVKPPAPPKHPANRDHPKHAAWVKRITKAAAKQRAQRAQKPQLAVAS